ncbi:MAG: YCF48-related protein [Bryobacteraceae bacterium]
MDLECPSATHCVAVGDITGPEKPRSTAVITNDGGAHWAYVKLDESPVSLFFRNASLGWMATDRGIWKTVDGGDKWKRLTKYKGLEAVWFRDDLHGWAIGSPKLVLQTDDGGEKWTVSPAASLPATSADETAYGWMDFGSSGAGVIAGVAGPPAPPPNWMNPAFSNRVRAGKSKILLLQTKDAGSNWKFSELTALGRLAQVRLAPEDKILMVFQARDSYEMPSSLYRFDVASSGVTDLWRSTSRIATDIILLPGGRALMAAIQMPGTSAELVIPGKLRVMTSRNITDWTDIDIDYRAVARSATFSAADADHVWLATDTGMILKLVGTAETKPATAGLSTALAPRNPLN